MVGEVLYPLNQLAAVNSEAYAFQKSKYAAREAALDFRIPGIDLLLGDTVHCASVHPYCVFRARTEAGIDITIRKAGSWLTGMFFAIPLERILHHPVVWYSAKTLWINGAPGEDVPVVAPADEFEPFDPARVTEIYRRHRGSSAELTPRRRWALTPARTESWLAAGACGGDAHAD
jgi:hypothetical protein